MNVHSVIHTTIKVPTAGRKDDCGRAGGLDLITVIVPPQSSSRRPSLTFAA